jgi:hypothetical protein
LLIGLDDAINVCGVVLGTLIGELLELQHASLCAHSGALVEGLIIGVFDTAGFELVYVYLVSGHAAHIEHRLVQIQLQVE